MQAECEGNRSIARQLHSHGMEVTERLHIAERNDMERVDKELEKNGKDYAEEVQRVRIRK